MKKIEGRLRKAVDLYDMIDDGDSIAIGVSGGKDSVAMLAALSSFRGYSPKRFSLHALVLDPRFDDQDTDYSSIEALCGFLGIPLTIRRTNIGEVVFDIRNEKNPCSLCARMRRGALHDMAKDAGCQKIALGHHMNDAVETLFLNLFHEGRLDSFRPKTYLSRKDITMIRPMIFCEERDIASMVTRLSLPVVKSRCPKDGHSERQNIKNFIAGKEEEYPGFLNRTFYAMQRGDVSGLGVEGSLPKFKRKDLR